MVFLGQRPVCPLPCLRAFVLPCFLPAHGLTVSVRGDLPGDILDLRAKIVHVTGEQD